MLSWWPRASGSPSWRTSWPSTAGPPSSWMKWCPQKALRGDHGNRRRRPACAALGLTITAAVRRRRRDLALLKVLGFTQHQLAACIAWQSTLTAAIGVLAGIPLGITL